MLNDAGQIGGASGEFAQLLNIHTVQSKYISMNSLLISDTMLESAPC